MLKRFFRGNCLEIISIIIAILALGLTIYQGIQTRYHNRLTVMPHFHIRHSTLEKDYSILIRNSGLGPGRITGIEVHVGKEFFRFKGLIDYNKIFNSLKIQEIADADVSNMEFTSFEPNAYIDKEESIQLIKLYKSSSEEQIYEFIKALHNIHFLFCYSSIYGDQFYISRRSGKSHENSCRFDNTYKIFGRRYRVNKNYPPLDTKTTHGYDP